MNRSEIIVGTCDGTGAAINVCLGFIPSHVKVFNMEDAGDLEPVVEWVDQMALITQMVEGIKTMGITQVAMSRTVLASGAGGIKPYNGGDEIIYDGETDNQWENSTGTSVEEVFVDGHYKRAAATDPAYRCVGDALLGDKPNHGDKVKTLPGFIIGNDSDLNVNGEQLVWIAVR